MPFNVPLPPPSTAASRWTTPRCGLCGLLKKCKSPKIPISGKGKRKILIVGEAPGADEDAQNKFFVGRSGEELEDQLGRHEIDMREDCWLYNALICRPPNNRTPTSEEISYCRPNLSKVIKEKKPNVILTVGRPALESVLTGIWKEDLGPIGRWVGWKIPSVDLNAWIIPTYHPSYVLRERSAGKMGSPIDAIFRRHLAQLKNLDSKPYETVPDYASQIEIIMDPERVAKILRSFLRDGGPISFDYETECLKPDMGGRIFTAAVCWRGKRTIAFPFYTAEVIQAWADLLASDCPKIGFNAKFEDRWTRRQKVPTIKKQKTRFSRMYVKNWAFDSMIGAHIVDNRRGICSLSFQTFVNMGVGDYSSHISKYLSQKHSYHLNNIKQAPLQKLLLYNGIDALMNFLIAVKQIRQLNLKGIL